MGVVDESEYLAWNRRVAAFWLLKANGAPTSYLTVTGRGLAAALWETDGKSVSADDAERELIDVVKAFYRRRILDPDNDIDVLATSDPSGLPLSLSFLAFSVLAASQMHADETNRSTAYYPRLAQLLECPVVGRDKQKRPQGLSPDGFAALWVHAHQWSKKAAPQPLFLPPTENVYRKYTAYPMSHVGLRQVDLDKLPEFFESADYAPGAVVALERLRDDFVGWAATHLTRQGQGACRDERLDLVVQEVAQELKAWDGIAQDARGRRVAHVELTLDVVRGSPRLSYLARRPRGFPEVFEHGEHTFDSLEEGWYDPLPIPRGDGPLLLKGFEWTSTAQTPNFVLRRGGAPAIAFVASEEYAGLTSRNRLLAGVESAVLYHESVAEQVERRIASLASSPATRVDNGETLPAGWRILIGVRIDRPSSDAVPGLSALEVDAAVEIIATGGLRIGRRAAWLVDAPPRLLVSGVQSNVKIDARAVRLGRDGAVQWEHLRRTPGVRVVEAGRAQMRLELVDAAVSDALPTLGRPVGQLDEHVVGLARGRWKLIGGSPEHVADVDLAQQRIVRCAFEPVFAIRQATPGCVLFLGDGERRPRSPEASQPALRAWAAAVVQASDADMPLATLDPSAARDAERTWRHFVRAGRECMVDIARADGEGGPA